METMKLFMILTIIPFSLIFLFVTILWGLTDIGLRNLSKWKTVMWSAVIILLPPFGALLYNARVRVPYAAKHLNTSPVH